MCQCSTDFEIAISIQYSEDVTLLKNEITTGEVTSNLHSQGLQIEKCSVRSNPPDGKENNHIDVIQEHTLSS